MTVFNDVVKNTQKERNNNNNNNRSLFIGFDQNKIFVLFMDFVYDQ